MPPAPWAKRRPWWRNAVSRSEYGDVHQTRADAAHIARWDPERVLAECEAKRRIVEDATEVPTISMRRVLRLLALPYEDHPDYRQEWNLLVRG